MRSPVQCPTAAAASLSKELYSHCSSPPSSVNVLMGTSVEVNAKLCMYHLIVEVMVGYQVPTASFML